MLLRDERIALTRDVCSPASSPGTIDSLVSLVLAAVAADISRCEDGMSFANIPVQSSR